MVPLVGPQHCDTGMLLLIAQGSIMGLTLHYLKCSLDVF